MHSGTGAVKQCTASSGACTAAFSSSAILCNLKDILSARRVQQQMEHVLMRPIYLLFLFVSLLSQSPLCAQSVWAITHKSVCAAEGASYARKKEKVDIFTRESLADRQK